MFYAELNSDNICVGVSDLSGAIDEPYMISLEEFDASLIGKTWNGKDWVETPKNEEENVTFEENNEYKQYYETVNAAILGGE